MSGSAPSAELLGLVAGVRTQADQLRVVSVRITLASATTRWQSVAARTFRERVRDTAVALRAAADGLDDAADLLERHAANVATGVGR